MYKIIAIDLDGTLLNSKKEITDLNKQAIKEAQDLGIKVVIATGRPYKGILGVIKELELDNTDNYVLCFNGGIIYHLLTNEIVYSSTITGKEIKRLYNESLKLNINIHAFRSNQELIAPKQSVCTDIEKNLNKIDVSYLDFNTIDDEDLFIKVMLIDPEEILNEVIPKVDKYWHENFSVVRSAKVFLEFSNLKANKGVGLQVLSSILNIELKNTVAIGDAENDLSMIKAAGCGVAMQNATDLIKSHSTFITKSNEDSGVGYAIKKIIEEA